MTRLILTTSDSGAGGLKSAGFADLVIGIGWRFVSGPLPSADSLDQLLSPRADQASGPHWLDRISVPLLDRWGWRHDGLVQLCARCESVELWIDPLPHAQLQAIWLLNHFRSQAQAEVNLVLRQADAAIGDKTADEIQAWQVPSITISEAHLDVAALAWRAYRAPTPQAWADLLRQDLAPLPQLRSAVLQLLAELPRPGTGLGTTEMRMLQLVSEGLVAPFDLFPGDGQPNQGRVYDYWETGALLDGLARAPAPALSGLDEGPFTDGLHDDAARFHRYKRSRLSLTPLGNAILAGEEDFSRHNPVHRWWGNTELTNANLWRWDHAAQALIAP